jgi:hypothetical protein
MQADLARRPFGVRRAPKRCGRNSPRSNRPEQRGVAPHLRCSMLYEDSQSAAEYKASTTLSEKSYKRRRDLCNQQT